MSITLQCLKYLYEYNGTDLFAQKNVVTKLFTYVFSGLTKVIIDFDIN